jgi:hypothetical protein
VEYFALLKVKTSRMKLTSPFTRQPAGCNTRQ